MRFFSLRLLFCSLATVVSIPLHAFDYMEHSFFTDRACHEAQKMLLPTLSTASAEVKSRYLALALVCPVRWQKEYCHRGSKNPKALINPEGEHSLTLGDYSALVDHITEYGRVLRFAQASDVGMTDILWQSLRDGTTSPPGVAGDIGLEECDTDATPNWQKVEADTADFLMIWKEKGRAAIIPTNFLEEGLRSEIKPGPTDPSVLFTIRNPRFLDLQLFNQNHFSGAAYRTWTGMHYTAVAIASMQCEEVIDVDESTAEDLAETFSRFKKIDWDRDDNPRYQSDQCSLLRAQLRQRLLLWKSYAPAEMVAPVSDILTALEKNLALKEAHRVMESLPSHLAALVFEGAGIHFMQDALSGGHIRTVHERHALGTTRRYHDLDSKNGVIASLVSREGVHTFVAFGDTYLLGEPPKSAYTNFIESCESTNATAKPSPDHVTQCLLAYQRGLLTAANTASLLDWSLGGVMYSPRTARGEAQKAPACPRDGSPRAFICLFLPLQPISSPEQTAVWNAGYLAREGLPPTPPPVDFQSLRIESSLDGAGFGTQIGARLEFLTPFKKQSGNWLYSYDFGFLLTLADAGRQQLVHEFAFTFHYRFATRLLINMGPMTYAGFEGFNTRTNFFFGMGLGAGITILPEGWTKIPLELTLSYRAPWRLVDTNRAFASQRIEGHWISLAVGLAFL